MKIRLTYINRLVTFINFIKIGIKPIVVMHQGQGREAFGDILNPLSTKMESCPRISLPAMQHSDEVSTSHIIFIPGPELQVPLSDEGTSIKIEYILREYIQGASACGRSALSLARSAGRR